MTPINKVDVYDLNGTCKKIRDTMGLKGIDDLPCSQLEFYIPNLLSTDNFSSHILNEESSDVGKIYYYKVKGTPIDFLSLEFLQRYVLSGEFTAQCSNCSCDRNSLFSIYNRKLVILLERKDYQRLGIQVKKKNFLFVLLLYEENISNVMLV